MSITIAFFRAISISLIVFGLVMLIPMFADLIYFHENFKVFLFTSLIGVIIGTVIKIILLNKEENITIKSSFFLIFTCWVSAIIYTAFPFIYTNLNLNFIDAIFESTSGITSCGASIIEYIENKSKGLLIYRALLNYIGGLGIVVIAIAILPGLQIGGMQLFKLEFSDQSSKIMPKISHIVNNILILYFAFTILGVILLYLCGMNFFDSITHSLTAISTGGFSNYGNSIHHFHNSGIEYVIMLLMILGAIPFFSYNVLYKKDFKTFIADKQILILFYIIIITSIFLSLYLIRNYNMHVHDAFRSGFFNVISLVTTSGFANLPSNIYIPDALKLILSVIGGCTGSTSGGLKIFRIIIAFKIIHYLINQYIHPHGIFKISYGNKPLNDNAINGTLVVIILYFIFFLLGTVLLNFMGYDFLISFSAITGTLSNAGFDIMDGSFTYNKFNFSAKLLLLSFMLLGRLEFILILVVFSKNYWKK